MEKSLPNYHDLQTGIDQLLGKFGLSKTLEIIHSLASNTQLKTREDEKAKLLLVFLKAKSIEVFQLQEATFYTSVVQEYKEARMSCYYLLKKYTDSSYAIIGEHFGQSKRAILYNYHKCDEMLSIPQYYKDFVSKFSVLEDHVINFIAKLN